MAAPGGARGAGTHAIERCHASPQPAPDVQQFLLALRSLQLRSATFSQPSRTALPRPQQTACRCSAALSRSRVQNHSSDAGRSTQPRDLAASSSSSETVRSSFETVPHASRQWCRGLRKRPRLLIPLRLMERTQNCVITCNLHLKFAMQKPRRAPALSQRSREGVVV